MRMVVGYHLGVLERVKFWKLSTSSDTNSTTPADVAQAPEGASIGRNTPNPYWYLESDPTRATTADRSY